MPPCQIEAVARAICRACEENPDHSGDCRGNDYRWQDYRGPAIAAMETVAANTAQGERAGSIPKRAQSQESVSVQLSQLRVAANLLGLYDAADVVQRTFLE